MLPRVAPPGPPGRDDAAAGHPSPGADDVPAGAPEHDADRWAAPDQAESPSLARSAGTIAIASLISRITGFAWKVMLVWVLGIGVANDSFNVANTLPNIVYELLLGGVLASIVVPLLVRSQDDPDGGLAYTQRLLTVALTTLAAATVIAVVAAPAFTAIYVDSSTDRANSELTTAFAYLLLPQVFFYGVFALLMAILNARNIFGPPAWAPVVNNLVIMTTIGVYALVPGQISLDPVSMGDAKILTLGVGVTIGIVAQAAMLLPPLLRSGFRFRWRWGIDERMKEFGALAAWIVGYVLVSQLGYIVTTRVLTAGAPGGMTAYYNAWLLFQLPYGVLGVSLLTAIMPRMSRAAADGDDHGLIGHLSYASRISTVTLLPIAAVMTVVGSSAGIALYSIGQGAEGAGAERLGQALAISAFGLLPYALVMLQLRVFYALKDARTPTLIMLVMTAVKVPLLYLCPILLAPHQIVLGAMLVNSLTFVVGAFLGQVWLWARLGNLRSKRVLGVIIFTVAACALGVATAVGAGMLVPGTLPEIVEAWITLLVQATVGLGVSFGALAALGLEELKPVTSRVSRLVRRS
ncbi:putative peptidoglycan lipid II flippase [Haloechinothrix alba]|uniref:Putative peptidoglycan lipid II flippase n=1 Tax=Haloechinothrix alba TaxID=664784 RepID=A0A238V2E0_9PSEU|nr:murein biosynthesis integral membrane protein MurJ [Haloechinothrix alba]SNR27689.1 putative peptidoglycan lipid II flippase [Haloechinothrix alba]